MPTSRISRRGEKRRHVGIGLRDDDAGDERREHAADVSGGVHDAGPQRDFISRAQIFGNAIRLPQPMPGDRCREQQSDRQRRRLDHGRRDDQQADQEAGRDVALGHAREASAAPDHDARGPAADRFRGREDEERQAAEERHLRHRHVPHRVQVRRQPRDQEIPEVVPAEEAQADAEQRAVAEEAAPVDRAACRAAAVRRRGIEQQPRDQPEQARPVRCGRTGCASRSAPAATRRSRCRRRGRPWCRDRRAPRARPFLRIVKCRLTTFSPPGQIDRLADAEQDAAGDQRPQSGSEAGAAAATTTRSRSTRRRPS